MRIDRCVCFGRTFADLLVLARETGAESVEELQRYVRFGQNCGLCRPYVAEMLRTGETVFDRIITPSQD